MQRNGRTDAILDLRKDGLLGRLVLTLVGVVTALTVTLSVVDAFRDTRQHEALLRERAEAAARLSATAIEGAVGRGQVDAVPDILAALGDRSDERRFLHVAIGGRHFGERASALPEAAAPLQARTLRTGRGEIDAKRGVLLVLPLRGTADEVIGTLTLYDSAPPVMRTALKFMARDAAIGLPFLGIALVASIIIARSVCSPLRALAQAAERVARDDFDAVIPHEGSVETRALAASLERMVRGLQVSRLKAERAAKTASEASRAKTDFLANMSHEIRTPMNGVIGVAELLLETDLDKEQRELAKIVVSSGSALVTIINDILDFSKIEAGKMTIVPEPFDLRGAVEDVITLLSNQARERDITLKLEYEAGLPERFVGDGGRVRQIVTNLVGNAVKFTESGSVVVRIGGTVQDGAASLTMEVEDTGIGIPAAVQERMFEKFEQADNTATRRYAGTGIGLSICRSLSELMGGTIAVRSELGAGSCFTVKLVLPLDAEAEETDMPSLRGIGVLILEPDQASRRRVADHARRWGMRVVTAADEGAALSSLASGYKFDLALLGGGAGLASALKAGGFDGPVVGLDDADSPAYAALVKKPVRASHLMDAVANVLYERSAKQARTAAKRLRRDLPPGLDVLVAEDNVVNQMVLKTMLAGLGAEVRVAANGIEALCECETKRPDVVVMDVSMPEMDGLEATRRIRAAEAEAGTPPLPIIAATAHVMEEDRTACFAAGMDAVIHKPVRKNALRDVLIAWTAPSEDAMTGTETSEARA
ncbi:hybrid sensor histidine kinase/response regulator [Parvularcula dongshanensis]|uniref:histidine kinase n=1 Tax=Parvularcula dongshanensis TaxID=1173995 RepID=A0A840I321_9PROT|nr:hybrid sensor histidine kinase/response regulator [Parvularcula dongshanensis]MBB4658681.1 signal transduction histidine kinase/CheY-like chemotaxis protein [Parvularcula dongshanensis]